jgi:hypothetical protein
MVGISPSAGWLSNYPHLNMLAGVKKRYQRVHLCEAIIPSNRYAFHDDVDSTLLCHLLLILPSFPSSTLDEEMTLEDLITDDILGVIIQAPGQDLKGDSEMGVMLLKCRGEFYQRVGFLRTKDFRENPGRFPYSAYRTSSGGFLNEVSEKEIVMRDPLWLEGATRGVIRVG